MPTPPPSLAAAERAFPAHPRLDRYYAAASIEAARRRVGQCLLRGDGTALVLGAPGVGKTMLLEVVAADLGSRLRVVALSGTQLCTRRALLQAILHRLDGPYQNREEGELRIALGELLIDRRQTGDGVALLVDEAQSLPVRLLEELRVLTNVAVDGAPRVRLVLAGTHTLDEAFTAPELDAFSQRLAARCYLEPLSREETAQYVRAHVAAAGGDPDRVLAATAYDAIALASDGLPRLVNQVADRALTLAAERGVTVLDRDGVSEAWSDLHQLAAPWQSPGKSSVSAAASPRDELAPIEYGLLDDEDEDEAGYAIDTEDDDADDADRELALQAEAAAVMALGEEAGVRRGAWNAGDKLRDLPVDEAEPGDDELVSYAFPGMADRETEDFEPLTELTELDEDDALGDAEPGSGDPFAEDFDEEELVLDPYATRERVIPTATVVSTLEASELGQAFASLQGPEPEQAEDVSPEVEVAAAPAVAEVVEPLAGATGGADDEEELLVIESDDDPAPEPAVRRQEYAELFANLRHG